ARHWIADRIYHLPELSTYLPLFIVLMFCGGLSIFAGRVLAGYKDVTRRTVITNLIGTPLMMALAVVLLMWGTGLWGYIIAQVIGALMVLLALLWSAWKLTPVAARHSTAPLPDLEPEVYSFSATVLGVSLLEFLMAQADKLLLGLYLDPRWVGIYGIAIGIVAFVPIILQSVNQIFGPTIADLHSRGQTRTLDRLYKTLTKWIIGLTVPLALVIILFSAPLMRLFGAEFELGWPVLVIGTIGQLVNCGVGSVGLLLLMSGNQRRLIRVQASMAAVALLSNIILIPLLVMIGAALASTLVAVGTNLWYMREVRRALHTHPFHRGYRTLLLPFLASLSCVLFFRLSMHLFRPEWLCIPLALVSAYVVFVTTALVSGLDTEEREIAGAAWLRIRGMLFRTVNV